MSEKTEATLRRRPRSVPFAGLATTRFGRALLLAVAAGAAYLALYQPSWAIDPLRDLVERTLEAFGAGTILVVLWALAFLTLLRYRTGTLFRRWRLVLGSAALVVAVLGGLACFDGPLLLLDEGNLGGEYGLTIQGDDSALGYARLAVVAALGLWILAPRRLGGLARGAGRATGLLLLGMGRAVATAFLGAKSARKGAGSGLLGIGSALRVLFRITGGAGASAGRTYGRFPLHEPALRAARAPRQAAKAFQEWRRSRVPKTEEALLAEEVGFLLSGGQGRPPRRPRLEPKATTEAEPLPLPPSEPPPPAPSRQQGEPRAAPLAQSPAVAAPTRVVAPERRPATSWVPPSMELFDPGEATYISNEESTSTAQLIETTLAQHGVEVQVAEVRPGPTVTMYGLVPGWNRRLRNEPTWDPEGNLVLDERGKPVRSQAEAKHRVKVDSILAREKDLALALAAPSLRIEAPVPGESVVGVEVPNHTPAVVSIRSVMESDAYRRLLQGKGLPVALGQASVGEAAAIDLLNMPHLLIAGATGSGKSVCIHTIIASLISHQRPSKVRLLLVDPKRVELAPYNGIPHLVTPVVTEADRVVRLLKATVQEMLRRYQLMEEAGVRNISSYNQSSKRGPAIPYLVICIDELADLMMASAYDIEQTICRLAQLGRATGIHLVVATQRPSVDVVTGLIKANFPSRISFAVASQIDSRTILDVGGAERLLGRGDMLFLASDAAKPQRVQGSFISEEETDALAEHWRGQQGLDPDELPLEEMARQAELASAARQVDIEDDDGGRQDALFGKAVELASRYNQLSTSLLQRRLRIGYPRAARLMDQLEDEGVVGLGEAGKPREVL